MNATVQAVLARNPVRVDVSIPRLVAARARRNQEPAANHSDMERVEATMPSTRSFQQTLTKTWGWA
jgi:hypothetical protein